MHDGQCLCPEQLLRTSAKPRSKGSSPAALQSCCMREQSRASQSQVAFQMQRHGSLVVFCKWERPSSRSCTILPLRRRCASLRHESILFYLQLACFMACIGIYHH